MIFGEQGGQSLFFQELTAVFLSEPEAFFNQENSEFQPETNETAVFFLIENFDAMTRFMAR